MWDEVFLISRVIEMDEVYLAVKFHVGLGNVPRVTMC